MLVLCPSHPMPPDEKVKTALDAQVRVEAVDVELAALGEFLGGRCDAELLIPATMASEKVNMRADYTTLSEVIARAGLVVR